MIHSLMVLATAAVIACYAHPALCQKKPDWRSDKSIFTETMVELTWPEVKREADSGAVVLFPIAVIEEHGPHLDLSPDVYLTVIHCRIIKRSLRERGVRAIIAPPYYWGINGNSRFPGSFTVRPETFKAMLFDAMESLKQWGFTTVFTVNLHGDGAHRRTLASSAEELRASLGMRVHELSSLDVAVPPPAFLPARQGKYKPDYHAGAGETAAIYAIFPGKVRTEIAKTLKPQPSFEPLGYVGDPASFARENGTHDLKVLAEYDAQKILRFLQTKSREEGNR